MGILDFLGNSIGNLVGSATSAIGGAVNNIASGLYNSVIKPAADALSNTVSEVGNGVSSIVSDVGTGINNTLNSVEMGASQLEQNLISAGGQLFNNVEQGAISLFSSIYNGLQNAFNAVSNELGNLAQGIVSGIEAAGGAIGQGFNALVAGLEHAITETITPIVGFISSLPSDIATIGKDVIDSLEGVGKFIEKSGENLTAALDVTKWPAAVLDFTANNLDNLGKILGDIAQPLVNGLLKAAGVNESYITADDIRKLAEVAVGEAQLGAVPFPFQNFGFMLSSFVNRITEPILQGAYRDLQYSGNASAPNRLVDVAVALNLYFRGVATYSELEDVLLKNGYDKAASANILAGSYHLLGAGELINLRFRGVIKSDEDLDKEIQALGYRPGESARLKETATPLLGRGDAIEMYRRFITLGPDSDAFMELRRAGWTDERIAAMRIISTRLPDLPMAKDFIIKQLNDPKTVAKYGLDQGLDQAFLDLGHSLGYDEETTKLIYYATWQFPPFFILESLYKSGELDKDTFTQLLTLEGTPPYFISKFVDTLAPKLTQADIKEMYKYQVITADQILTELEGIGITGILATKLQKLWVNSVKLASPLDQTSTASKTAKVKELTEGTVMTAYADNVITRETALNDLLTANYSEDEANLLLDIEDYKIKQKELTQEKDIIKEDLAAGILTFEDAINQLQALNPTPLQFEQWYAEIKRMTTSKPKLPSIAELKSWVKKGVVSLAYFAQQASLLGWNSEYIYNMMLDNGATSQEAATAVQSI